MSNKSGLLLALILSAMAVSPGVLAAPKAYAVNAPVPSGIKYETNAALEGTQIFFSDDRSGEELEFSKGTLTSGIELGGVPIKPMQFLTTSVQQELASRGVPVTIGSSAEGYPRVTLHSFRIRNYRTNAYSPFVTFTYISADIDTGSVKKRVGVFVKRGKVPVWSFKEIIEPTLNQPLSVAIKELSSKLSDALYNYRASDATVDSLLAKVSGKHSDTTFLDVYSLGFSNNARATAKLVELTKDENEYVRLAAISSLGNLHAADQLGTLKAIYQTAESWQDRGMALKAIGDLDTEQGKAFLTEVSQSMEAQKDPKESGWTLAIIRLYQ